MTIPVSADEQACIDAFPPHTKQKILETCRLNEDGLVVTLLNYASVWEQVPGAPAPNAIPDDEVYAAFIIDSYNPEKHTGWEDLKRAATRIQQAELDQMNPFLGVTYSKTDDRSNTWTSDSDGISDNVRSALNNAIKNSSPLSGTLLERFQRSPSDQPELLRELSLFLSQNSDLFFWGLGDDETNEPEWRWGHSLCLLGGLGISVMQSAAKQAMQHEPDWQHWGHASEESVVEDIQSAHDIHGIPCGLLRLEWRRFKALMHDQEVVDRNNRAFVPRWAKALLAIHIFNHCRVAPRWDGGPVLIAAYRGNTTYLRIPPLGLHQPICSRINASFCSDLCKALAIPYTSGKTNRTWMHDVTSGVLRMLRPDTLARARDPNTRTDILVPPRVSIQRTSERSSEYRWVDPGIAISGVAHLDMDTGTVYKNDRITGPDAIAYAWPLDEVRPEILLSWDTNVPDHVEPALPWDIFTRHVKNVNTLGHPDGVSALFNALILLDLCRPSLAGTSVGSALQKEYPVFTVMPVGHEKESTTNQGKTFALRIVSQCCVPRIGEPAKANRTSSAPAQRSVAAPIEEHGTAAYDEFILPLSKEHFLDQAGIQNLSTGGTAHPGRAGENSKGISLRHPLFLSAKVAAFPPDVLNRMMPVFLDGLTPETMSKDQELEDVLTGRVSLEMRLSALRLIHVTGLRDMLLSMRQRTGQWRFNTHISVVGHIFEAYDEACAYLQAAMAHADKQRVLADASGLSDDIGISETFDPHDYWEIAYPITIQTMHAMAVGTGDGTIEVLEALRSIIESGDRRSLEGVLREFRTKERAARMKMVQQVKDAGGSWVRRIDDGTIWQLSLVYPETEGGQYKFKLDNIAELEGEDENTR